MAIFPGGGAIFPPPGGDGGPWLGLTQIFVSPSGADNNDGLGWPTAKKTIYEGLWALYNLGGGTIYIAEGSEVGGPVPNQGIRIRKDFMPNAEIPYFFAAEGFVPTGPIRIVGCGQNNGVSAFRNGVCATFQGGGDSAFNPKIWIVGGGGATNTMIVENLRSDLSFNVSGTNVGVDFDRKLDGTVKHMDILNATRTGNTTVYTVDLDATAGIPVTTAERTSNVTTLTINNPGYPWMPWKRTVLVRFSGDVGAGFPAGDYELTASSNAINDNVTWTVSYADPGLDTAPVAVTATLKTHGCITGDLINLATDAEFEDQFQSTQYWVDDATIDTITVTDVFDAEGDADEDDIGTLARQERFYCGTSNVQLDNVAMAVTQGNLNAGPAFNIGHTQAIAPVMRRCWTTGYVGDGTGPRDERRMAGVYVYPGTCPGSGPPCISIFIKDTCGTNGSIFCESSVDSVGVVDVRDTLIETQLILDLGLPALRIDGNDYMSVYTDNVANADADFQDACVVLNNCPPSACIINRSAYVDGSCVGGNPWFVPAVYQTAGRNEPTPWSRRQTAAWADVRIAGKHPAAVRAMGPVAARFQNIIAAPGSWLLRGATLTTGQQAPDGSATAVKVLSVGEYLSIFPDGVTGDTWEAGGKFAICGWINAEESIALGGAELFRVLTSDVTFVETTNGTIRAPYTGSGWQFVSAFLTVDTVSDSTPNIEVEVLFPNTKVMHFWGMTAFYIPPTAVTNDDNDIYELLGTLKHQPRYLAPGMTGTMEAQKFIAHGGLGINSGITKTVGAGSGQLTLTGSGTIYHPVSDDDGSTILGWVALLQATVNP